MIIIMMMMILLVLLPIFIFAPQNCAFSGCGDFEFDNVTPYRDETIDKKRPRRGLMNREEADDSIAPIGEVVGWIVL